MREDRFYIGAVPAILYGAPADRGYLFLHGQMGRKEEARAFAQVVCPRGFQVLSIDLPGHGDRQDRGEELFPWTAAPDIQASLDFAKHRWNSVSLWATSIGAYVALLAFDAPEQALLVSPGAGHGGADPDHDGLGRRVGGAAAGTGGDRRPVRPNAFLALSVLGPGSTPSGVGAVPSTSCMEAKTP